VGRRALGALGAAVVAASLTACGGDAPAPQVTVTVSVTPSSKLRGAKPPDTEGSIAGRRYDVGTIVATRGTGRSQVLVLDRFSVRGVEEEVVARDGVPIVPESGDRFSNENLERLYDVPLGDDVRVVINRCLPAKDPAQEPGMLSRPATLGEFLSLPNRPEVVTILRYAGGRLVRLETSPQCPARPEETAPGRAAPSGTQRPSPTSSR
jgi:hypothetical protein